MGGRALKRTSTRRYNDDEFQATWKEIKSLLTWIPEMKLDVKSYSNKQSHGDMDILVAYYDKDHLEFLKEEIINTIKPTETFYNDSVVSMNYRDLQVDFMFTPIGLFNTRYHFFAYNDLGGFMGKVARSMKLKYGQKGLQFDIYSMDKDRKLKTVTISTDPKDIIEFLGFDYYRFIRGFESKEDIFEFVANSKYFRTATFDGSELNSSQKSRDMGRPMYQDLLKYIEDNNCQDKIPSRPLIGNVMADIDAKFDIELQIMVHQEIYFDNCKQVRSKRFNGSHIIDRYNITPGR